MHALEIKSEGVQGQRAQLLGRNEKGGWDSAILWRRIGSVLSGKLVAVLRRWGTEVKGDLLQDPG